MQTKKYLDFALTLSRKAGKIASNYYGKKIRIDFKDGIKNNLVTEIDKKIENFIVKEIKRKYPDHCVLSEEGGDCGIKQSTFRWIIDPIDGTTNYAHCYNFFAISIGLEINGKLMAGVVNAPILKELFHASRGNGAYLNNKKISVSKVKELDTSLLATGFTHRNRGVNLPNFEHFLYNSQGIRRCGAATIDLCYVACGRLDGYWEMGLKPWDMAAGALIVEEAGGLATSFTGSKLNLDGKNILAANRAIHEKMRKFFKDQPLLQEMLKDTP